MRFRIIIADEDHARIAKQGFVSVIEREAVSAVPVGRSWVEGELRRRGELPQGYRVAGVVVESM